MAWCATAQPIGRDDRPPWTSTPSLKRSGVTGRFLRRCVAYDGVDGSIGWLLELTCRARVQKTAHFDLPLECKGDQREVPAIAFTAIHIRCQMTRLCWLLSRDGPWPSILAACGNVSVALLHRNGMIEPLKACNIFHRAIFLSIQTVVHSDCV